MKRFTKDTLSGLRVLVGRTRHQASALSRGLKALGADVIEIPFIEIRKPRSYKPLDSALKRMDKYDWLILTSVNGADAFATRMKKLRLNPSALQHLQIAAIGPATRAAIENRGLKVAVVPEQYVAESVVKSLRRKMKARTTSKPRARGTIANSPALQRRGSPSQEPSPVGTADLLSGIKLASIGPITSSTLRELGLPVHIEAAEYTIPGLINAIVAATPRTP